MRFPRAAEADKIRYLFCVTCNKVHWVYPPEKAVPQRKNGNGNGIAHRVPMRPEPVTSTLPDP